MTPKLDLRQPTRFSHHRSGWSYAAEALQRLHVPGGVPFYDWADRPFRDGGIDGPWCGILHNVLTYPSDYPQKYSGRIHPLTRLVELPAFRASNCRGLFTLCRHTADFLRRHVDFPVHALKHPVDANVPKFVWGTFAGTRQVVALGQWLRRYHSFFELNTTYAKLMPRIPAYAHDYEELRRYAANDSVRLLPYLANHDYDRMLQASVVFLDLYDAGACNVLLECLVRHTPLLVRRLPATAEYLGDDYPLFFESLAEAEAKLHDDQLLRQASNYLAALDKGGLTADAFLADLTSSPVYSVLKVRRQLLL